MKSAPFHSVLVLTGDWQPVAQVQAYNVDLIAAPGNAGNVYIQSSSVEHFPLIPGQIQDYAKDGVNRVDLSTILVKGTAGEKLLVKGEC